MITIHYNGIRMKDCVVRQFHQQIIRDTSGTDRMYSRFQIRVEATLVDYYMQHEKSVFIHNENAGGLGNAYSTVECMQDISGRLNEDRKEFWMTVGGQVTVDEAEDWEQTLLLACGDLDEYGGGTMERHPVYSRGTVPRRQAIDVENGPHTASISIEQIFGGRAMRVGATFTICRVLCDPLIEDDEPPTNAPHKSTADEVLSNKWSLTETKNEDWQTVRAMEGTVRTKNGYFFAHAYRNICVPPLLHGYKRISQRFASDPTDTVLKYSIIDRAEHASAPPPATSWNAVHTETTTANGSRQVASVNVKLTGPPGVNKHELIATAGKIITSRIEDLQKFKNQDEDQQTILNQLSIVDHMNAPTIEMSCHAQYTTTEYKWLAQRIHTMGEPLEDTIDIDGYHPRIHPVPLAYDSNTPASLMACYFQHPCSQWHMIAQPDQELTIERERNYNKYHTEQDAYEYPALEPLPEDDNRLYEDSEARYDIYKYPYTLYTIGTTYESGAGKLHLPLAKVPVSNEPTSIIAQVHGGITRRIVEIEAVRDGHQPLMPKVLEELQDPNGIKEVLLDMDVTVRPPSITADGTSQRWGLAIKLTYGLEAQIPLGGILQAGALPIDVTQPADTDYNMQLLQDYKGKVLRIETP